MTGVAGEASASEGAAPRALAINPQVLAQDLELTSSEEEEEEEPEEEQEEESGSDGFDGTEVGEDEDEFNDTPVDGYLDEDEDSQQPPRQTQFSVFL